MKHLAVTTLTICGFLAFAPVSARAEANDHLKCSKIVDGQKTEADIRIDALDDRFDSRRCKVLRPSMLCSPSARTGIDPAVEFEFVEGDEPATDYVCYKTKCRKRPDADIATDAFGTRRIGGLRSKTLCVPAGPAPEPVS
jgi:hypothetical protein